MTKKASTDDDLRAEIMRLVQEVKDRVEEDGGVARLFSDHAPTEIQAGAYDVLRADGYTVDAPEEAVSMIIITAPKPTP